MTTRDREAARRLGLRGPMARVLLKAAELPADMPVAERLDVAYDAYRAEMRQAIRKRWDAQKAI